MAEQAERRKSDSDLHGKIDAMIGMLTLHMTKEEVDIQALKDKIDEYFHDLDAHTHLRDHRFVDNEIIQDEKNETRWEKIKTGLLEKALMFMLGSVATYLIAITWVDFGRRIQAPITTPPAIVQPAQVTPNVPNQP